MNDYEDYPLTEGMEEEMKENGELASEEEGGRCREELRDIGGWLGEEAGRMGEKVGEVGEEALKTGGRWVKEGGKWVFKKAIPATARWLRKREEYKGRYGKQGKTRGERIGEGSAKAFGPGLDKETKKLLFFGRVRPGFYTGMTPAGEALKPGMVPAGQAHATGMNLAGQALQPSYGALQTGIPLGHMRALQALPQVDRAVYEEIKANGDHDTHRHIHKEVGPLGFGGQEINSALVRLRKFGLITKSGKEWGGEKEYEVTSDGNRK